MAVLPQLIANGIIAGSIYALVALGYSLVYSVLKFINFAHGEIFMVGAYIGWLLNIAFNVPFLIAIPISMLLCGIIGYSIEKIAYKPLRKSHRLMPLISAIGVSLLMQSIILLLFGAEIRTFRSQSIERGIPILGSIITKTQLIIILTAFVVMFILYLFFKHTKSGKAIRAVADNITTASIVGINVNKTISLTFILGSALAALAGILVGMEQNLSPTMGISIGIKAFTATVIGGIGSIPGAFLGSYLLGLVENIGIWFLPSGYKDAITFFLLIIFIIFKPTGIIGSKTEEALRTTQ